MSRSTRTSAIRPVLLWTLAAVLLLLQAGHLPLLDMDEARFAETSVEMLSRGDLVVPWFENHHRLQKPPLINWAQILSLEIFHVNEFSFRLPSIVSGLGLLVLVLLLGRSLFDRNVALRAGFILVTTPLFFVLGRIGTIDMTLGFLILFSIYFGLRALRPGTTGWKDVFLCGLGLGLCLLAKGPVGLVFFFLVISGYMVLNGDVRAGQFRKVLIAGGIAVAAFLPWLLLLAFRVRETEIWSTLQWEVFHRFWQGSTHREPFAYYLLATVPAAFPWSCFLPGILFRTWKERRSDRNRSGLFLLVWLLLGLLFLSLCRDKLVTYMFPLFPALALLIARSWKEFSSRQISVGLGLFFLAVVSIGLLGMVLSPPIGVGASYRFLLMALIVSVPVFSCIFLPALRRSPNEGAFALLVGWSALFLLSTACILGPDIGTNRSFRGAVERIADGRGSSGSYIIYRDDSPSLFYYSGRKLSHIITETGLRNAITACHDCAIVIRDRYFAELPAGTRSLLHETDRVGEFLIFLPARNIAVSHAVSDADGGP